MDKNASFLAILRGDVSVLKGFRNEESVSEIRNQKDDRPDRRRIGRDLPAITRKSRANRRGISGA